MAEVFDTDVVVVGGGNAGMCAALAASGRGARVVVLEAAPQFYRGGNSRHTRDFRIAHSAPDEYMPGQYSQEEFLEDLHAVNGGDFDAELARLIVAGSAELPHWLSEQGVKWQPPLAGTLHLSRTNRFLLGGGRSMLNAYYRRASRNGVEVWYESPALGLVWGHGRLEGVRAVRSGTEVLVKAKAAVIASGGFEANLEWLRRYWGDAVDNFIVRGSPFNTGQMLQELINCGAETVGGEKDVHAVAVDGRAPKFDGGIVTRLDSVPMGIVVNKEGKRFYDEGEDFWPKRYAIWGRLIAHQPGQEAYSIVDSKVMGTFMPSLLEPVSASTLDELARRLGVNEEAFVGTVRLYNRSVRPCHFDPRALDTCCTEGLEPPKSHWALPIDRPPFYAWPLRPGITFTFLAARVDGSARVVFRNGSVSRNVFAAGEIIAGNVLRKGYLAGFGLTMGAVMGRIAGEGAADEARRPS